MELSDLKRACNGILGKLYPDIGIYGTDTQETQKRPCFFTEIVPYGLRYETRNFARISAAYKITYLERVPSEEEQLRRLCGIREAFGMVVTVGSRKLRVTEFSHEYTGEYNNILQVSVAFDWYENTRKPESGDRMQDVTVHEELRERGNERGKHRK